MAMFGQFLRVPQNFEISWIDWDQVRGTTLLLNSLRISAVGQKFGEMMYSMMKQNAM